MRRKDFNTAWQYNLLKCGASIKCVLANRSHTYGNYNFFQGRTILKCASANALYCIGNCKTLHRGIIFKRIITNCRNQFAITQAGDRNILAARVSGYCNGSRNRIRCIVNGILRILLLISRKTRIHHIISPLNDIVARLRIIVSVKLSVRAVENTIELTRRRLRISAIPVSNLFSSQPVFPIRSTVDAQPKSRLRTIGLNIIQHRIQFFLRLNGYQISSF